MSDEKYPSIDLVRQCFRYENGRLFWLPRPLDHFADERAWKMWMSTYPGTEAGCRWVDKNSPNNPRWLVGLNYGRYLRSSLVWAMHHGTWGIGIDHVNRDSLDDRIENMRIADKSQNGANSRLSKANRSGYKGVSWDKARGLWMARIQAGGVNRMVGRFADAHDAHLAYMDAAKRMSGEFASDGRPPSAS